MRVGWETEQVSRCRTPRECGSASSGSGRRGCGRATLARTWKEGEVRWVRGKGKELAARWASLWTGGKRLGASLSQHIDYILRDASCLDYLRIPNNDVAWELL